MLNLYLRFWLFCNKKPNRPIATYLSVVMSWFMLGVVLTGGLILIYFGRLPLWFGLGLILLTILFGALGIMLDWKEKYIEAIHRNYLARRKRIAEKLGKKEVIG